VILITSKEHGSSKIGLWLRELRAPFLIAVILPTFLGGIVAANEVGSDFNLIYFILTLIGITCIHLGANISNDYFDYKSGADVDNPYRTPFSGGSGLLSETDKNLIFYGIGSGIGIFLDYLLKDPLHIIFLIGLGGVGLSFFYTAPPFKFAYKGVGEIAVAVTFGPFVVVGSYYVQTVELTLEPLLASIPLGVLIAAILYVNEFPDHFVDKRAEKRHWVVMLGFERAIQGYIAIMTIAFGSIVFGIAVGFLNIWSGIDGMPLAAILTMIALPLVFQTVNILKKNYKKPLQLIPASANTLKVYTLVGIILCAAYITRIFGF
jgi:1,4-dihydroxy-2-naphthoate octaprenyltransferase